MNLEAKKLEFAEKYLLEPEFHSVTQHFDQTALAVLSSSLRQELWDSELNHFERLILSHGMDECLEASLDIPYRCTKDHFNMVADSLGFELIGYYSNQNMKAPSATSILARPDGLIIVADSVNGKINGSELAFQWVSNIQGRGDDHPGGGVGGNFEKQPDGRWAYFGYYNTSNGTGFRPWLNSMINRGQFLSPMCKVEAGSQRIHLVSGIDWSTQRRLTENNENQMYKAIRIIERQRFERFPQWVQEMIGPAIQDKLNLSL